MCDAHALGATMLEGLDCMLSSRRLFFLFKRFVEVIEDFHDEEYFVVPV